MPRYEIDSDSSSLDDTNSKANSPIANESPIDHHSDPNLHGHVRQVVLVEIIRGLADEIKEQKTRLDSVLEENHNLREGLEGAKRHNDVLTAEVRALGNKCLQLESKSAGLSSDLRAKKAISSASSLRLQEALTELKRERRNLLQGMRLHH